MTAHRPAQCFKDLIVWQRAHSFVLSAYQLTKSFPKEELFGLTSQLRRAAVSIAANIAEGFKKRGKADKIRFYNISQVSIEECKYYLILARDLEYGHNPDLWNLVEEVSKLLESYIDSIVGKTSQ